MAQKGYAKTEALQSLPFHNLPVPGNKKLQQNHPSEHSLGVRKEPQTPQLTLYKHTAPYTSSEAAGMLSPTPSQQADWELGFATLCFVGHFCFGLIYFLNHRISQSYAWSCAPTGAGASKGFENRSFGIAASRGKCLKDPGEGAGDSSISDGSDSQSTAPGKPQAMRKKRYKLCWNGSVRVHLRAA